ncbi:MAG: O-antigen ligase family protein [Ruminococcus sp.]|nr:O-antigen ligase family protein [Ruminococcus sp.]
MDRVKAVLRDSSLFRRSYIICLFLANVSFIQLGAYAVLPFLFLWGIGLLIYNEIKKHTILKIRFSFWLMLFMLLTTLTALIHITDNFLYNLVIEFHFAICFFLFYSVHTEKHHNFRRELYSVCRFIVYFTTVVGIIGLAFLMAGISFEVFWVKFIVYENRFTGFYTNPNLLGFVSCVAILCCHMLLKKDFIAISGKDRVSRIWIATCLAINLISLLLCDSNGAMVLMVAYAVFFIIYKFFGTERQFSFKQVMLKGLACMLAGVFIVGAVVFVRSIFQKGFSQVMYSADAVFETISPEEKDVIEEDVLSATNRITFSHQNKNIDSGRLKLWKQAAAMFEESPILGIGKGNIYSYGEKRFENGIAFSDLYGEWLAAFATDFHNGYATLLVCSGVLGFVAFAVFGIRLFIHVTPHVFKERNLSESIFPPMYSFASAYLIYAFFEKALLYDISFTVLFFWMILGYIACFLVKFEPEDHRSVTIFKKRLRRSLF